MGEEKTRTLAASTGRAVLLLSTLVSFILCQLISAKLNNPATSPFNTSIGNESEKYQTGITPAAGTFAIWGLIYTWQGLAVLYVCSLLFRKSDGKPLFMACQFISSLWCLAYSVNLLSNPLWNVVFLSEEQYAALVILIAGTVLLLTSFVTSVYQMDSLGSDMTKRGLKVDIWLTRILVQNGTALYLGWSSCASLIGGVVVLVYELGMAMDTACWIALVILATVLIVWFSLETFAFDRQLRYVFGHYIAYLFALVGNYIKNFDPSVPYTVFEVVLMVVVVILALAKLIIMLVRGIIDPIVYPTMEDDKEQLVGEKFQAYKIKPLLY